MIDITHRIGVIQALLSKGGEDSLTYAALECRLTIEQVCYERLRMSYGHISYDDLRTWQPKSVVQQIVEDANELAASGFILSVSRLPVESGAGHETKEEFEALEYVTVGEQASVDFKNLGKLWNALASVALHSKLPTSKDEEIPAYGDVEAITSKVLDAIKEFEKLKGGTLLAGSMGPNYYFDCELCGTQIRRIASLLRNEQVINCIKPSCDETYLVHKEGDEIQHSRRLAFVKCEACSAQIDIPTKRVAKLRYGEPLERKCTSCGASTSIHLIPVQSKKKKEIR